MLTRSNYSTRVLVMMVNTQAAVLWDVIEDDTVPHKDDPQAVAVLIRFTPLKRHNMLARKTCANDVWAAI